MIQDPKIKVSDLNNNLFSINKTQYKDTHYNFFDFSTNNQLKQQSNYTNTISTNIYSKTITMNILRFSINDKILNDTNHLSYIIRDNIINKITEEYIKKSIHLGYKHREKTEKYYKYDISINDIKNKIGGDNDHKIIARKILSKIYIISNIISMTSRFGPANILISNNKVYNQYNMYISEYLHTDIKYIINNSIKDDIIVIGRRSTDNNPGIHCFVQTDENDNIKINIKKNENYPHEYILEAYYNCDVIGFEPENLFFVADTKTLSEHRFEKLKKLNMINDQN